MCNCSQSDATSQPASWAVPYNQIDDLVGNAKALLNSKASSLLVGAAAIEQTTMLHCAPEGFGVSESVASGGDGSIVLRANLGLFEVELHLAVKYSDGFVEITAELLKPFPAGPFTWRFRVGESEDRVSLESVSEAKGITPSCVLECASILGPVIVECLPQIGTPAEFVKCLLSKAGSKLIPLALCLFKCLK